MASGKSNELFMRIMTAEGKALFAECQTEVTSDYDNLILDYYNGEFFQLDTFRLGLNIEDGDATAKNAGQGSGPGQRGNPSPDRRPGGTPPPPVPTAKKGRQSVKFERWKAAKLEDVKKMKFDVRMDDCSITRVYDKASLTLFEKCARSEPFPSASIVKRKVVGGSMLQTFLRFDFKELLITSIQFEDSDVLKETVKFTFRELTVQYKKQDPSGKLAKVAQQVQYKCDVQTKSN